MKKTYNIIFIISVFALFALAITFYMAHKKNSVSDNKQTKSYNAGTDTRLIFSDGLGAPDSVTKYDLDEFDIGVTEKSIYYIDINNDGEKDRITKTFTDTGNAHSYYTYKIELKNDKIYTDITPKNLKTTNGASCDLQQIQFSFAPKFKITIISRELGDTWLEPTMAYKQEYTLSKNDKIESTPRKQVRPVCDVKELF